MERPANIDCLDPETLAAYVDGLLARDATSRVDRHIDRCRACRNELSALAATLSFPDGSGGPTVVVEGAPMDARLGRYEVLRELGRGSMGVVVRAYDPELARAVAVKLLSSRVWAGADGSQAKGDARERLRREAQAMARLSHPNVVAVYDVGMHGDSIFIAMELIEGETLRHFVLVPRPWRTTLDACIQAGRGLAAAHAAKLVHRDYKPENVLIGRDGRVAVSDFGLAHVDDERPEATTLAGTPAYMAPEVLRGEPASTASDQYSFCVATYEALYGERPSDGAAPRADVPAWLRAILQRGLARDPAARFPSMTALLDALEATPRRRTAMKLAGALLGAAAAIAGAAAWRAGSETCAVDLGDTWSAQRRADVRNVLGADEAARIERAFDRYATAWLEQREAACDAPERVPCLDRGLRELDELVGLLVRDPAIAPRIVEAVGRLRDPASCTAEDPAGDPAIDRASALVAAGKASEALDAIAPRLAEPTLPVRTRAEALLVRGRAESQLGQSDAAEATLSSALTTAERARADQLVAAIWVELVQTTGAQRHRFEAAHANVLGADAAFARVQPGPALRARYTYVVGAMYLANGKLDLARTNLERALALLPADGAGERGLVESGLCDVDRQQRRFDAAEPRCTRALELLASAYGPAHGKLAHTHNVAGALALDRGDLDAAQTRFERAAEVFEAAGLVTDRALALALNNAGVVRTYRDDIAGARSLFERSSALFAQHHAHHPQRVMPLQGLASLALETGDYRAAIARYEEALGVIEQVYGKDADQRTTLLFNLALAYQRSGNREKAVALLDEVIARSQHPGREVWPLVAQALDVQASIAEETKDDARSIALRERALGALDREDRPETRAWIESQLGKTLRRTGAAVRAIPHLERAVAHYERDSVDRYQAGQARFSLARALWDTRRDRVRAVALGRAARDDLAAAQTGFNLAALRASVDAWLRSKIR